MTDKHTPGPWSLDRDSRIGMEWNIHVLDRRGHAICFMAHSDGKAPERDEANAALIGAAPELLSALRMWMEIHDKPAGFAGKYGRALDEAIAAQQLKVDAAAKAARAAILKAEHGEALAAAPGAPQGDAS